jgi:hypothetical protein
MNAPLATQYTQSIRNAVKIVSKSRKPHFNRASGQPVKRSIFRSGFNHKKSAQMDESERIKPLAKLLSNGVKRRFFYPLPSITLIVQDRQ